MQILKVLFFLGAAAFIGGFGYFAVIDVPVTPSAHTETLPNDRFFPEDAGQTGQD